VTPENSTLTPTTFAPSKFYILGTQQITASTSTSLGTNFFVQVKVAGASGAGVPTGTVSFSTNGNTYGPFTLDTTGSIYIPCGPSTVCDLPIGTYTFTAKYSGDNSFNPSTTTFPFTITKGKINYSALLSSQTPPVNSTIIATAYFNFDPAVVPTGTVTLTRDDTGAVLATGQIGSNGTAVIPFVAAAGNYNVIPSWPGDSNYTAGIVTSYDELIPVATGTVNTTTAMTVSSKTATIGGRTQIVITVTPQSVVKGTSGPSGTVTIRTSNGEQAQPVTIVGGQANTYLSWTSAGPISIYATYNGDTNYNGSGTALTTINVAQATPTVQLQARAGYVAVGSQTSVTANLVSALIGGVATSPTGTVQFYDSVGGAAAVPIGAPQPLNVGNGSSILATLAPVLSAGVNTVTAGYSGDANWTAATSGAVVITVTTPDFTASATPNPLTVAAGQTATIAISSQSILGFSSPISVSCGTLPPGMTCNTATITPGAAGSITLSTTAPGTTMAKASFGPRLAFGVTGTLSLAGLLFFAFPRRRRRLYALSVLAMVGLGAAMTGSLIGCGGSSPATATSLVVTSANTKVASGSAVTLQATVTSANSLTGTVTFYDGGTAIGTASTVTNNVATLSTSSLAVGTHAITAKYSGDSHNLASQSSDVLSQTITGQFMLTLNATAGTPSHPIMVAATLQ